MLRPFFAGITLALLLTACSDNGNTETVSLLNGAPYDNVTDSIGQAPQNAELYYRRGGMLYSNNQPRLAEKDLRTASQLSPKEEYALSLTTLLREKNTDTAIVF